MCKIRKKLFKFNSLAKFDKFFLSLRKREIEKNYLAVVHGADVDVLEVDCDHIKTEHRSLARPVEAARALE